MSGRLTDGGTVLLVLDLIGTFAFAVNGALAGLRAARLDIMGVVTLGIITAIGGGTIRDVLLGSLPPATFLDWRYYTIAGVGGLIAFLLGRGLERLDKPINVLDAAGLSLFAITGAAKAVGLGFGPLQCVLVGAITDVGGGTIRDLLTSRVPSVLSSGLYAVPALIGATIVTVAVKVGVSELVGSVSAAVVCFLIRIIGIRYNLDAPYPRNPWDTGRDDDRA